MSLYLFYTDTSPTEIYTLSLHDALPISSSGACLLNYSGVESADKLCFSRNCSKTNTKLLALGFRVFGVAMSILTDRKSTRLNSSHTVISYAVFCLKKKR